MIQVPEINGLINAGLAAAPVGLAFMKKIRNIIKERASHSSELSGRSDRPLEAAHLDHSRGDDYNNPDNGLLVADLEHLAHHILHKGCAGSIGLSEDGNNWAIEMLSSRVYDFSRSQGISDEETYSQIINAVNLWIED